MHDPQQAAQPHHAPQPPQEAFVFDLDGGRPCLDFANTLSSSGVDHVATYGDLVAFADQSQLVTRVDAAWLHAEGERDPAIAQGVLVRARRLRDALRAIFAAIATDRAPSEHELSVLNFDLAASLGHARVLADGEGGYRWGWAGRNLDAPLWPITRSAADVLTSEAERRLVRQCGASDCSWLFVDTTRNRSRQWCSMASCGNREKARRHYQRQRASRSAG